MAIQRKRQKKMIFPVPDEIVEEILLKLPVKSLTRFKSVCKSWFSLLSARRFAQRHLGIHQIRRYGAVESRYSTSATAPNLIMFSVTGRALSVNDDVVEVDESGITCPPNICKLDLHRLSLCSCSGLVLVAIYQPQPGKLPILILWNPTTRQHKQIPRYVPFTTLKRKNYIVGFGYDDLDDNYKVVLVFETITGQKVMTVYDLRRDSWKQVDDQNHQFSYIVDGQSWGNREFAICLDSKGNRNPHWLIRRTHSPLIPPAIIYFDVVKERFQEVPMPAHVTHNRYWDSLDCLDACLCYRRCISLTRIEAYVMKEYGVQESWTKIMSIDFAFDHCFRSFLHRRSQDGRFLVGEMQELGIFDPKSGEYRHIISLTTLTGLRGFRVATYLESLISPNSYLQ